MEIVTTQREPTDICALCRTAWQGHSTFHSDHEFMSDAEAARKYGRFNAIPIDLIETMHNSAGKLPYDQVPVEMLTELAKVLQYGVNKYSRDNWKHGTNWSEFYGSTLRHLFSWWRGEDVDPESGCLHLAHAICNLTFLIYYHVHTKGTDNREVLS